MLLMHKDIPTAKLEYNGSIIANVTILDEKHYPIGASQRPRLAASDLQRWFAKRAIPAERQGLAAIEAAIGCAVSSAAVRAMQVSLTDCYWVKEEGSPLSWGDVNYHENGFSEQLFDVVINKTECDIRDLRLPDLTTDGVLPKTWIHSGNTPILVKRGNMGMIEPGKNLLSANEIVVSRIANMLGFDTVPYNSVRVAATGERLCACPCFIDSPDIEYISALDIQREHLLFERDLFDWFCDAGMEEPLKDMLYLDHLVRNTDRHERNFGVICRADDARILKMAPLFDSGTCLDWNGDGGKYRFDAKPFSDDRYKQLALLSEQDIRKRHKIPLSRIQRCIRQVYKDFGLSEAQTRRAIDSIQKSYKELSDRIPGKERTEYAR